MKNFKLLRFCVLSLWAVCALKAESLNWESESGKLEQSSDELRWRLPANQRAEMQLDSTSDAFKMLRNYEWLSFDFRVVGEGLQNVTFEALGHVSGLRRYKVHQWDIAIQTTEAGVWHHRDLRLDTPSWFPWDQKDGHDSANFFKFIALSNTDDVVVEFRNVRLFEPAFSLKPDFELPITWPHLSKNADGESVYTIQYSLLNTSSRPNAFEASLISEHQAFDVVLSPSTLELQNGATGIITLTATLKDPDALKTLEAEPLQLKFFETGSPQEAIRWAGVLVKPLPEEMQHQVLLSSEEQAFLRTKYASDPAGLVDALGVQRKIAQADSLLEVDFRMIPRSHNAPRNRIPTVPGTKRKLSPSQEMPRVVDAETGLDEFSTPLADQFWLEYMNLGGGAESLAVAYLTTQDRRYAEKAAELFKLYGNLYSTLTWDSGFEPPWGKGPPLLASSRISFSSTYGSNWFFKNHAQLLSAIADADVFTAEEKEKIYADFILPYATELIKFPASISNMTDITNHNILLLGIVFDDATLVYNALYGDAGLLNRVTDIAPDGFSSEGRPLNYHYAAMAEYLNSLIHLRNSGVELPADLSALPQAIVMPYQRANLAGMIPNTGDSGRWNFVRKNSQAAAMSRLFPEDEFLVKVGTFNGFYDKVHQVRLGIESSSNDVTPYVFNESIHFPDGGMVILREGKTAEEQVMVSLDYGPNPFHGAYDRNQLTLSAYGLIFSHGPGSSYNMGRGGMTYGEPADTLRSFLGSWSVSHNLVVVNQGNQSLTAGELVQLEMEGDRQLAASRLTGHYPGVTHERAVLLEEGIVVILDRVQAEADSDFDFIYHNVGQWGQRPAGEAMVAGSLGTTGNYDQLLDIEQLPSGESLNVQWDLSQQTESGDPIFLDLHQQVSQPSQFFLTVTGMNNPNAKVGYDRAPTMMSRVHGTEVTYLTVLEPNRGDARVQKVTLSPAGEAIVTLKDGTTIPLSAAKVFSK